MSNCGNRSGCGCSEQPLSTQPPNNTTGDCTKESCAELFCEECIVHCQPEIQLGDIVIEQGARLNEILQKLLLYVVSPDCVLTTPIIKFGCKTSTSITMSWTGCSACTNSYRITWTTNNIDTTATTAAQEYTITNLLPNTTYLIKVTNLDTACESVIMKIKTKLS